LDHFLIAEQTDSPALGQQSYQSKPMRVCLHCSRTPQRAAINGAEHGLQAAGTWASQRLSERPFPAEACCGVNAALRTQQHVTGVFHFGVWP
jgi:hypothetical protein